MSQGGPSPQASVNKAVQGDRVEISGTARLRDAISRIPDIRTEKVAEAKRQIASGELDTPANMDVAMNRLIDDALGA
jgi:anti-sigma28 factor (negative regulator of flagellin synthesis)